MLNNSIEVAYSNETVDGIYSMPRGIVVPLLNIDPHLLPITKIESNAIVIVGAADSDLLHISSQVDLEHIVNNTQVIAESVISWLQTMFLIDDVKALHKSTGLGIVVVHDVIQKDVTSLLMPFNGGRQWIIGSAFDKRGTAVSWHANRAWSESTFLLAQLRTTKGIHREDSI